MAAMMESKSAMRKRRVFVYVPFSAKLTKTSVAEDFGDPNFSAQHWVNVRNSNPDKRAQKEYFHISGPEAFRAQEFRPGDRIYVHAHGAEWGEIYAKGGKVSGEEIVGRDKHTPASLLKEMRRNKTFAAFGTKDNPLDLRIAACHSGDDGNFIDRMDLDGLHGRVKGKTGEFSANTGRITRSGIGTPFQKRLDRARELP